MAQPRGCAHLDFHLSIHGFEIFVVVRLVFQIINFVFFQFLYLNTLLEHVESYRGFASNDVTRHKN